MSNTILVLKDGTTINMEDGSTIRNVRVLSATKTDMVTSWDKFTNENLKTVETHIDDSVSGKYADLVLDDEKSIVNADGTILTEFHLREKTDIEKLQEMVTAQNAEIAALKEGQGVQDGAIDDLGVVTSTLAEQIEGGIQ